MKAAVYRAFRGPINVEVADDPVPPAQGVVIRVMASGLCLSDWHGWQGHDADIRLPHVPGHELAGIVEAVGSQVRNWRVDDRVTVPFVCGCGACPQCDAGQHQVCDRQFQPGFTHWGSFAQYVAIDFADTNLVALPESIDFVTAASLGCRFVTAFRAVVAQGGVGPEQWLAVHGCGGVGLSAIMIGRAMGARVIAVDIDDRKLALAGELGAEVGVNARTSNVVPQVMEASAGGVHVSIDALGSPVTSFNSIACLAKRGRHVQVGLLAGDDKHPSLPMDLVVARELEIVGSHGMQAHCYGPMLAMIESGELAPAKLVGRTMTLGEAAAELPNMDRFEQTGVSVIDRFY
ncbi:MAG: alcohol dehydrogenase [Lysobacteraceae bacterium]|nr:MAG: alcohol dehydrogenase [Xanthomonadaceae bacterium]